MIRTSNACPDELANQRFNCPGVLSYYEADGSKPKFETADEAKRGLALLFDLLLWLFKKQVTTKYTKYTRTLPFVYLVYFVVIQHDS
jgi:hypothetical protein